MSLNLGEVGIDTRREGSKISSSERSHLSVGRGNYVINCGLGVIQDRRYCGGGRDGECGSTDKDSVAEQHFEDDWKEDESKRGWRDQS